MKNVTELRDQLAQVFSDLREGKVDVNIASQLNNTAGKIIKSAQVQLEYTMKIGDKKPIAFLSGEPAP